MKTLINNQMESKLTALNRNKSLFYYPKFTHEYLHHAINEIEDYSIILLDIHGNILNWNRGAKKIKGYCANEIIGKNFRQFYTQEDRQKNKPEKLIKKAKIYGKARDENWRIRKDGTVFWGNITITALHNSEGVLTGFIKVTHDLTEHEKALELKIKNAQLESKNEELKQFTYMVSHDLKSPLNNMIMLVEFLKDKRDLLKDNDIQEMLKLLGESSKRMKSLIEDILDYSLIGVDKIFENLSCNELIRDIQADLSNTIKDTRTQLIVENLPNINGCRTELRLLFQNLIENSIKYCQPDRAPLIKIKANKEDKTWHFSIKDNGIGISKENCEVIFKAFTRLPTKKKIVGSGIGLASCYKIIQLHGGKIWLRSKIGQGTTFHFTIPE